jgi:hypothetical protein
VVAHSPIGCNLSPTLSQLEVCLSFCAYTVSLSAFVYFSLSVSLMDSLSRSFVELCRSYCIGSSPTDRESRLTFLQSDVEECAPKRLCSWCSVIQIPSVTSRVRLRHRTKRSKVNQSARRRVKNEIVYHCLSCDRISSREEVCRKPIPPTPTAPLPPPPLPSSSKKEKKKFNFIDLLTSSGKGPSASMALDFIPLSSMASPSVGMGAGDRTPGEKRRVSLLELEESRRSNKKKRKSGSGLEEGADQTRASFTPSPSPGPSSSGLGALRSIFTLPQPLGGGAPQHSPAPPSLANQKRTNSQPGGGSQGKGKSWKHSFK